MWKYMPPEWRNARKGQVTNITYSVKGGFTEAKFVAPNQSVCIFRNYAQDPSTIEGGEIDACWCDELVPLDVLETFRFRLVDRNGKLFVTFTPVQGWSPTVADYLNGAKNIQEIDAELLPRKDADGKVIGHEQVPIEQINPKGRPILYFHTQSNPWAGWSRMKRELQSETREKILTRAYGVPTKAIAGRFPLFNPKVHVIRHSEIPNGTRYHWVDPASGKNWFMLWTVFDPAGRTIVYREWPNQTEYIEGVGYAGEWALPDGKRMDGRPGPAMQDFGFGLERYKDEILRVEAGEQIFERWMDSRYGHSKTLGKEAPTTLIDEMASLDMFFTATPGDSIDEGVGMINDALSYNPEKPVDARNQPRLYISENCKNTSMRCRPTPALTASAADQRPHRRAPLHLPQRRHVHRRRAHQVPRRRQLLMTTLARGQAPPPDDWKVAPGGHPLVPSLREAPHPQLAPRSPARPLLHGVRAPRHRRRKSPVFRKAVRKTPHISDNSSSQLELLTKNYAPNH
jgi:phage terminase large subunit-like protein